MAYVQRIEVPFADNVPIVISERHNDLPEDQNWDKNAKAVAGTKVLYDKDANQASERPFAFLINDTEQKFWEIEVRNIWPEYHGKGCIIIVSQEDTYASREALKGSFMSSDTLMVGGATATFRMSFNRGDIPFGWFGKYKFLIREDARPRETDRWLQEPIPLEAYYLSAPHLPDYFGKGIPLLLLRMFVLPIRWVPGSAVEDWHDHWLKYESGAGNTSFSSPWGLQGLNLEAWLDAWRNWDQHRVFTHVNCYDQAAITEIALCLGVAHEQIHWEFHQVYGFIKDTQLVGWGDCNNPYFGNDPDNKVYSNLEDPNREPFRNHAYLSWSKKLMNKAQYEEYDTIMKPLKKYQDYAAAARKFEDDNGLELFMIDACAGPHVGDETREKYESQKELIPDFEKSFSTSVKIDYAKSIKAKNYKQWGEEHHLGAGVTTWNNWKCPNLLPDSEAGNFEGECSKILQLMRADWMWERGGVMSGSIKQLEEPFFDVISQMQKGWENKHTLYVRPYRLQDGGVVHEIKVIFTKGQDSGKYSGFVSMRVAVNKSPEAASKQLASHLAFTALTTKHHPMEAKSGGTLDGGMVYYIEAPKLRAFACYNIAIDITSTEKEVFDVDTASDSALWQRLLAKMGSDMPVEQDMSGWEKFVQ